MTDNINNARDAAVLALKDREGNVSAHLDRLLAATRLSPPDRAFARELGLGTIRRRATLRAVLNKFLSEPGKQMPGVLPEILLVALYQLLFLDRVPQFAAVNEAVEQAARFRHNRQSGVVNGILRNLLRNLGPLESGLPPQGPDILPITHDSFRRFAKPIFPDPAVNIDGYIAAAYSLPVELVQRWLRQFGAEKVINLAAQANVRAPLVLRPNTLKIAPAAMLQKLLDAGVKAAMHVNGLSIVATEHYNVLDLPGFDEGFFQPQDATATAVPLACRPKPGMRVLDFCAAPGTKATHMAELMNNEGSILALDVGEPKLERIRQNCRRMGITIIEAQPAESAGSLPLASFDLVLADVPCSNTGVLARRPEARWRFNARPPEKIVRDQQFLASAACQFVRPGGHLVYSTCSIELEENVGLIRWLKGRCNNIQLVREQLTLPGGAGDLLQWHDGGYYAIFEVR